MSTERWEAIRARVAELGRASVRAGVIAPQAAQRHSESELTNGEIAILHELGSPSTGLPERSFVRKTLQDTEFRAEYEALCARIMRAVIEGKMSRDRGLGLLGTFAAGRIQRTITEGHVRPELKPATVEAKGSSKVLVDSGQLVGAISWGVEK